jgi:DNA polymerase-4
MTTSVTVPDTVSTIMHVRCPDRLGEAVYRQVLELMSELSPVVQALPPTAALVELKGALRYHGTGAHHLGGILRVRTLSRFGVDVRVGIGLTITVAATASAQIPAPGGVLAVAPEQVADWLGPLPVEALHGIGPRQAQILRDYGVHCVGLLAAVPPATVHRLLVAAPAGSPPTGPAASTRAPSSPAPCPRPRPCAAPSSGTSWTAPPPAPPSSISWSGSARCCAAAPRWPARSRSR